MISVVYSYISDNVFSLIFNLLLDFENAMRELFIGKISRSVVNFCSRIMLIVHSHSHTPMT
jgi:hypothetical protein